MCSQKNVCLWLVLFLIIPNFIICNPVAGPEIAANPNRPINSLTIQQAHQQQHQQHHQQQQAKLNNNLQDAQLNTLTVYATNYDMISSDNKNQNDKFKPSYKLPEMENNFTPVQNSNNIAPDFAAAPLATHAPVLMQYLPQTINEGGIQYLQLIPTRPLMVPLGSYMGGNNALPSLTYHQQLTPNNAIEYAPRPLMSTMPVNIPPPAPSPLLDVNASQLPAYGVQPYNGGLNMFKQNHRINRETKNRPILGPINLNMNEYLPPTNSQPQHGNFNMQGRP